VSSGKSSFGKRVVGNTFYSLADLFLTKISTTIVFIILVRVLPDSDIAAIGVAMGYLVFISYMDVAPIRVLMRDYPKISKDKIKRDELLTALFCFWLFQSILMLSVCAILNKFVLNQLGIPGVEFLFFAMTVDFIALSIQGWLKLVYYTDFRQRTATYISFLFTILRLVSYGVLFVKPSLITYSWILIVIGSIACIVWATVFTLHFNYRPLFDRNTPKILVNSLKDYGLWDHFNRTIVDTLFVVDIIILSSVGYLSDVANYTVALKFTSLLAIIPAQLSHGLQVMLSNYDSTEKKYAAMDSFIKFNALISVAQLSFILIFGGWLIRLLFGADTDQDVITYSIVVASGVTIFNFGFPFMSIVNNYCNIREAFITVFLPCLFAGIFIYYQFADLWGALGVAYGNIVSYSLLTISLIVFTMRKYPYRFKFQWVSSSEKNLFQELLRKGKVK